jgi:hypothetical protein
MKNHHLQHFIFIFLSLTLGACVSVNIPTSSGTPAKDIKYDEPSSPFSSIKVKSGDKAWISSKTGNTISFLSDCNASNDPSLQQLENDTLVVLDKLKILSTKQLDFNGREASATLAQGEVDGVPVKTQLLVFKKNNCNFTLSYGGVLSKFDSEKNYFDKFTESFKAP